ncbi:MAG: TrmB family transcriptional regulator [Promethearchaeota archaeon]|nr:MAG: TrmB family transcriptional regulator [Candidatus Lokiarchaeota archaeon]
MSNDIPDSVKESLREIGLTDYEISIYLTLICKGPMDARELSEASGVPYSRIYNILTQLEKDKKWIIKEEESRPSRYFAKSPDEALIIAKKQYNDGFDKNSNKIIQTLTPIYQSHDQPIKIALYIHRGRDICLNRAVSLIENAKTSLYLVCSDYELLEIFLEDIKKARARGVTNIKLLIEESTLDAKKHKELIKKYQNVAEIKSRDQIFGIGIMIDEGEDAFIILTQKFFERLSYFGVYADHIAFSPAAVYYFNYLYQTANEIEI